jgi:sugar lactone lactonase YvrE
VSDDVRDSAHEQGDEDARVRRTRTALVAVLVLLALLLVGLVVFVAQVLTPAGAPRASSDTPVGLEWIRSIYGYGPSADQQFLGPVDTAVGPDGRIWVTDPQRARVLAFNPDGSYSTLIHRGPAASGAGRIVRPEGVGTDEDGNVYVCDYGNEKVMVFSGSGELLREWPVPLPSDVAVRNGRVYVVSVPGVAVFDTNGTLIAVWGHRGRGPDEFDGPRGIAVGPDGTVYVADTLNGRAKAYDRDGNLRWIWPESRRIAPISGIVPTSTPGGVQLPASCALDGRGRLILVDAFGFNLVVLRVDAKQATVVARYGEQGSKDGFFTYPTGLAYDQGRDWFAVADTANDRVQIVRIPGSSSNAFLAAVRRALPSSWWWCVIPLALLALAIALALLRRRARARDGAEPPREGEADGSGALDSEVSDR